MTLKQAVEFLANTPTPYKLPTLRKAVQSGALKSELKTADGTGLEYRVIDQADLMTWAERQSKIKRGNPNIATLRKKASNTK